jgi:hypothetical protein
MSRKPDKPYQVGYGKPPSATRFKKGKSGNPSGRPKKFSTLDPGVILDSIDNEEIVVIDEGKRKRMTKAEIHIRQLFSSAIKGDMKAARQVVEMAADYLAPDHHVVVRVGSLSLFMDQSWTSAPQLGCGSSTIIK